MSWAGPVCIERHWLDAGRVLLLGGLAQLLAACATVTPPAPDTRGFTALATDGRIWHEAGGEDYAVAVSRQLDPAVARVEAVHGLPFPRPPRVLVCQSADCFRRLMPVSGYTAVVLPSEWLLLSPRLDLEEHERLPAILAHELSHLHLGQRLGHYTAALPVWFHEGLASLAGEGGGAEFSSDEEACGAWDAGRRIDFARLDSPGKRHRAADFKLSIHQFYRQSWRFMQYLRRRAPAGFDGLLGQVQAGKDLSLSVANAYNADLERLSLEFDFDSR